MKEEISNSPEDELELDEELSVSKPSKTFETYPADEAKSLLITPAGSANFVVKFFETTLEEFVHQLPAITHELVSFLFNVACIRLIFITHFQMDFTQSCSPT